MIRKSDLALAATAALGAAALPRPPRRGHHTTTSTASARSASASRSPRRSSCLLLPVSWVETRRGLRRTLVNVCVLMSPNC